MCRSHSDSPRARCGCQGESRRFSSRYEHHHYPGYAPSGGFGVRRPLRFLAWKLQLEEPQLAQLAAVLNELKTERGQAEVDDRRALSLLADAAESEPFDRSRADEAAALRVKSAESLQRKVAESLGRIHALLTPEQRGRLAYLLRTGLLTM